MAGAMLSMAAPPNPCSTRMRISRFTELASAQPSEASVKTARPIVNWLRKPTRADSAAKVASVIATASR